jgi:hypothetical protein
MPATCRAHRPLLVVGTLADVVEDQFRACSTSWASARCSSSRRAAPTSCRRSGRTRPSCWPSPSWPTPRGRSKARGAKPAGRHPSRWGPRARRVAARRRLALADQPDALCQHRRPAPRARRSRIGQPPHAAGRPQASSSSPTRSSRCRWPASCRANWAWRSPRWARPTCTARTWRRAGAAARRHRLSEGQDVERQLDRCRACPAGHRGLRPGPGQPAGGRGHDDQVVDRAGVHADPGLRAGGDLAELFTRPLTRHKRLKLVA